jgi:hypothetical protein
MMLGGVVATTVNRNLRQQTTPEAVQRALTSSSPGIQSSVDRTAAPTNNGIARITLHIWNTKANVNGVCHADDHAAFVDLVRLANVSAIPAATTPPTATHRKAN